MNKVLSGLWQNTDFVKLWAGESISLIGSQVTLLALPLTAALTLSATPLQMGILGTLQFIPWLIVGLFAGAYMDRVRRRPVMIMADVARVLLLGSIPVSAAVGLLQIDLLYVITFLVGVANVFFDIAYAAYLPTLVPADQLLEGNSKLQSSASIAEISGPGLGGALIQLVNAPLAIAVDALSFLVSAAALSWIKKPELRPNPDESKQNIFLEIRDGLRLVFSNPILRAFALASVVTNFFIDVHLAVFLLYATRQLALSPVMLGGMYAIGSIGGLLGSFFASRLAKRFGLGRAIVWSQSFVTLAVLAIPLSGGQIWIAASIIVLAQAVWGFAAVVYIINTVSLRQAITENRFQGRVTASLRFVTWGIAPLGFLLGGVLGQSLGLQATLLISAIGPFLSVICLVLSPVLRMQKRFSR